MSSGPTVPTKPRRVREQVIERQAPRRPKPEEKAAPVERLEALLGRPEVPPKIRKYWRDVVKALPKRRAEWTLTLLELFQPLDPSLTRPAAFENPLRMALAYALVGAEGEVDEATWLLLPGKTERLQELRFRGGGRLFDPASPEFSDRMAELSAGYYDEVLTLPSPKILDKEASVWLNPRAGEKALADERGADLVKFVMRGRADMQIQGPPCPRCKSRNTYLQVAQFRSNDEAATEHIYCRDCGR